jgi:BirA family biotin operon repressor/biotin-[acetyl-CoA-carboxylase] ligase
MLQPRLIEFGELDSTNRYACAHLAELQHGDVIRADLQTGGRGRLNRSWVSHVPGNLCLSLVLKPDPATVALLPVANLSQLLAVCICRALDTYAVSATVKWPNDIQIDGRKLAGILAETVTRGSEFQGLVLGLGMNLNLDDATLATIDQPATSLSLHLGASVSAPAVGDAVLREFFGQYDAFMHSGFQLIREEFLSRCPFLGNPIKVRRANEVLHGRAMDVNADGALVLVDGDGQAHVIDIAEMFV